MSVALKATPTTPTTSSSASSVSSSFSSTSVTVVQNDGSWKALLPSQQTGGDYTVTATSGSDTATLQHVTFGDVYFCSGYVCARVSAWAYVTGCCAARWDTRRHHHACIYDVHAVDTKMCRVRVLRLPLPLPLSSLPTTFPLVLYAKAKAIWSSICISPLSATTHI